MDLGVENGGDNRRRPAMKNGAIFHRNNMIRIGGGKIDIEDHQDDGFTFYPGYPRPG